MLVVVIDLNRIAAGDLPVLVLVGQILYQLLYPGFHIKIVSVSSMQFTLTDVEDGQKRFILLKDRKRESCDGNPGYEVDVYFRTTLRDLSAVWWGEVDIVSAIESGRVKLSGLLTITRHVGKWFPKSSFAACNARNASRSNE